MAESYSALQLGYLPWKLKYLQGTVWSERPYKDIQGIDDWLEEMDLALPALAGRITRDHRSEIKKLLKVVRSRHHKISQINLGHYLSIIDKARTRQEAKASYKEYLREEATLFVKERQKEDRESLQNLLGAIVKGDSRLEGYYEIGDHAGRTMHELDAQKADRAESGQFAPLAEGEWRYLTSGIKKLPLHEQKAIERFFKAKDTPGEPIMLARIIKVLGRFLRAAEETLVAKPKWDGRTISYLGRSKEIRIQENSIITHLLDEGERQGWPDTIPLKPEMLADRKQIANALTHFHSKDKLLEFSVNGDRVAWGPPGTTKRKKKAR